MNDTYDYRSGFAQDILKHARPLIEGIFFTLKALMDATNDPVNNRCAIFTLEGVATPDHRLTGGFHNSGLLGEAGDARLHLAIAGQYGSRIDADLIFIEYDSRLQRVDIFNETIVSYTTAIRLTQFCNEVAPIIAGWAALPADSVILPKLAV